jgi:hypothetical protein
MALPPTRVIHNISWPDLGGPAFLDVQEAGLQHLVVECIRVVEIEFTLNREAASSRNIKKNLHWARKFVKCFLKTRHANLRMFIIIKMHNE